MKCPLFAVTQRRHSGRAEQGGLGAVWPSRLPPAVPQARFISSSHSKDTFGSSSVGSALSVMGEVDKPFGCPQPGCGMVSCHYIFVDFYLHQKYEAALSTWILRTKKFQTLKLRHQRHRSIILFSPSITLTV